MSAKSAGSNGSLSGAEVEILAGVPEREAPHIEALEACADLIEQLEKRVSGA